MPVKITRKGTKNTNRSKHKYFAKVPIDEKNYRYFYSKEEYDAYLNGKQESFTDINNSSSKEKKKESSNRFSKDTSKDKSLDTIKNDTEFDLGERISDIIEEYNNRIAINNINAGKSKDTVRLSELNIPVKKTANTIEEDCLMTNPNYSRDVNDYYSNNCAQVCLTYELRRRGYDVTAPPANGATAMQEVEWFGSIATNQSPSQHGLAAFIDDAARYYNLKTEWAKKKGTMTHSEGSYFTEEESLSIASKIQKEQPSGSRGMMSIQWASGSGHAVMYEVGPNGPYIVDPQNNTICDFYDYLKYANTILYQRTDDKKITGTAMKWFDSNDYKTKSFVTAQNNLESVQPINKERTSDKIESYIRSKELKSKADGLLLKDYIAKMKQKGYKIR